MISRKQVHDRVATSSVLAARFSSNTIPNQGTNKMLACTIFSTTSYPPSHSLTLLSFIKLCRNYSLQPERPLSSLYCLTYFSSDLIFALLSTLHLRATTTSISRSSSCCSTSQDCNRIESSTAKFEPLFRSVSSSSHSTFSCSALVRPQLQHPSTHKTKSSTSFTFDWDLVGVGSTMNIVTYYRIITNRGHTYNSVAK